MRSQQIEQGFRIQPALAILLCFAVGIVVDRFLSVSWQLSLAAALVCIVCWVYSFFKRYDRTGLALLAVGIVAAGSFWHHGCWNWFSGQEIAACAQSAGGHPVEVCLRGVILGEARHAAKADEDVFDPIPKTEKTLFRFSAEQIRNGNSWSDVSGTSTLTIHTQAGDIRFGDRVEVVGKLVAIGKPRSPGQFDFQKFFRAKGQLTSLHALHRESVTVLQPAQEYSSAWLLSILRQRLDRLIQQHVGDGQAGFASAILLGNREQLEFKRREKFQLTGTSHLLAISGLHIGILATMFLIPYRLGLLRRRSALLLTICFVLFYSWLVEFRPPVVRASVLVVLFCIGRLIGKSGADFNLIALAGIVVLILNPADLFNLGPQLSFLAFTTLVVFKGWIFPVASQDPIDRLIRNSRSASVRRFQRLCGSVRQLVLVSALIWLIGLPIVAANFHLCTPVAVLVNPVVLLPLAVGLFAGLGVCLFGIALPFAPSVADGCGWLCAKSLGWVAGSIEMASQVPGGHCWTAGPTSLSLLLFYGCLFFCVLVLRKPKERTIIVTWCCLLLLTWLLPFQSDKFFNRNYGRIAECTFIDVGHGSSVLLEFSNGQNMLYDAGSLASSQYAATTVSNLLWSRRIEHLDAVLISHADLDHFNALPELLRRFSIGMVYVGCPMTESDSESVERLFDIIQDAGVRTRMVAWDDCVRLADGTMIEVLMPPEIGTGDNDNSNSVVLDVQIAGQRLLLPGDLEQKGMEVLVGQQPIDYDIVMMPHHGSKNSRPVDFLKWSTPECAVVCASHSKVDANVMNQITDFGCAVLPTAEFGTIQFRFHGERFEIQNWEDGQWKSLDD